MEKQEIISAINSLSYTLDALTRAGATNEAKVVIDKLVELTEKL